MLVVCEQCHTKYVVPDEKVVKSVLRLPCQKCGHVITMRVEENKEQANKPSSSTLGKWRSTALNTPRKLQSEAPAWYYSYNGESHGPFTEQELKEKLLDDSMSEIATQCYIWRKTFKEWKPVLEVEPFASALLMPPPPPAKPAISSQQDNLPPLFSGPKGVSEPNLQPTGISSAPDLLRLKHRLQNTDAENSFSDSQRESLTKLANSSSLFGKVEKDVHKQNDVPTHTQIPVIDNAALAEAGENEEEEVGDTTRVAQLSPLASFQNLDAILSSPSIESTPEANPQETTKIREVFPQKEIRATAKEEPLPQETKETTSESATQKTKIPSLSSLPFKSTATSGNDHKTVAPFGGLPKPGQGISSLFGNKSSITASGNATKTPSFGGLKSFSSLNTASQTKPAAPSSPTKPPSTSFGTPFPAPSKLNASKLPPQSTPKLQNTSANSPDKLLDDKEDIGDILKQPTSDIAEPVSRDESSSWIPSQSDLKADTNLDEILLGDITMDHDVIDYESASDSLPSFAFDKPKASDEIPDLDLDSPDADEKSCRETAAVESGSASVPSVGSDSNLPSIDVSTPGNASSNLNPKVPPLPGIDANGIQGTKSASNKDSAALHPIESQLPATSDVLPDIDIDEDSMQLTPKDVEDATQLETPAIDDDDQESNVLSAFESLSKPNADGVDSDSKAEAELSELGAIDLDDESSQMFSQPEIDAVVGVDNNQPKKSGIVEYDNLFDDLPDESNKSAARASHSRLSLDEIAEQHKALFEESEKLEKQREDEASVSESSMLIQLNHFQKITEQDKRKSKFKVLAIAIPAIILFVVLASGVWFAAKQNNDEKVATTGFATVKGSEISSEDLNTFAPEDEFEILDMSAKTNTQPRRSKGDASKPADSGKVEAADEQEEQKNTATAQAAEAIYGSKQQPDTAPAQPTTRQDGRAGVILNNNTDSFASTNGVSGSKYANKGSSRELFALGLKRVSTSVQDCSRRIANKGGQMPPKVIMNLVIQPEGTVGSYEIIDSAVPPEFDKCLSGKKDTWKFTPFDGNAVKIKQSFILG